MSNAPFDAGGKGTPHVFRLRISNVGTDHTKVSLTLPVGLVGVAQRSGAWLLPPDHTIDGLVAQAEREGRVEITWIDEGSDERLELTIE